MDKKVTRIALVVLALCFIFTTISYSAESQTAGQKVKGFWQKLFNYPANVTQESAAVVADTAKGGVGVVTKEVKTLGQVTSGDVEKTKDLVIEPVTGTADVTVKAVQATAAVPANAAKEETPKANQ